MHSYSLWLKYHSLINKWKKCILILFDDKIVIESVSGKASDIFAYILNAPISNSDNRAWFIVVVSANGKKLYRNTNILTYMDTNAHMYTIVRKKNSKADSVDLKT